MLKKISFWICVSFILTSGFVHAGENIRYHFDQIPLQKALDQLIRQYDIRIVYQNQQVGDIQITAVCESCSLSQALDRLLESTDLMWRKVGSQIIIAPVVEAKDQKTRVMHGVIQNAETGEYLPNANIQIVDTYRGTISNAEGKYQLEIRNFPAVLKVRYIGYQTKELILSSDSNAEQNVTLTPSVIEFKPITVTDEDPGVTIMREVIKRKQTWSKELENYHASCFGRFSLSNDTGIVCIAESQSDIFWDQNKGYREVVKSGRLTDNIQDIPYIPSTPFMINFYQDDINIAGFSLMGPTHPHALDAYRFHYAGERVMDGKTVFDIEVSPKMRVSSCFKGRISVLDDVYAIIDVALQPSEAFIFPMPIKQFDITLKQQYNNYGGACWLPVDLHFEGTITIGVPGLRMPTLNLSQVSRVANYEINTSLPDTLFKENDWMVVDSMSIRESAGNMASLPLYIPVTEAEAHAYETLDSTHTLTKAFKPSGLIGGMSDLSLNVGNGSIELGASAGSSANAQKTAQTNHRQILGRRSYDGRFNRVEAWHLGLSQEIRLPCFLSVNVNGGYSTGIEKVSYGGEGIWKRGASHVSLAYSERARPFFDSSIYPAWMNSISTLLGFSDYYDYFWERGWFVTAGHSWLNDALKWDIGYHHTENESLGLQTDYNLFRRSVHHDNNPAVEGRNLRFFSTSVHWGDHPGCASVVAQKGITLTLETSEPEFLDNDWQYTQISFLGSYNMPTFFSRRLMPNMLHLHVVASHSWGKIPFERLACLNTSLGAFTPFGGFRALKWQQYAAEKSLGVFWEHDFRTVPFELLGLNYVVDKNWGIILHGGSGRTWTSSDAAAHVPISYLLNDWHHELGLSLNGLFGLLRVDMTRNLETDKWQFGLSLGRIF